MVRAALIAFILLVPFTWASSPQHPPCVPLNSAQLQIQTKSEEWVHFVRVFEPINIFAARDEAKGTKKNVTMIAKASAEQPKVKAKAKKATVKKRIKLKGCKVGRTRNKHGICGRWK